MSDQIHEDDGLTEEEAAALAAPEEQENPDVDPSEQQNSDDANAAAATADAEVPGDPAADLVAAAGAGDADAAAAADAEPAPAPAPAAEPATTQPEAAAPILIVQAPADAQEKLAKIATDKGDLIDKFEAGEITTREYQAQLDALNDQAADIKATVREAELAQKMEAQRQQNQWDAECATFLDANAGEYRGEANADRFNDLNVAIQTLARMPVNKGIAGPALLAKAHAFVKLAHGEAAPVPTAGKQKPAPVPKPVIPPTNIGKLPAADMADTSGGEFAVIDRIAKSGDVDAYEDALSKLSDAQRARYLRA